ncbi:hypothetical protein VNI00_003832 [Paramarasmius palmivorus]|uniref:Cytochrome P450 n=1 Tax=Paramarasmius palmivorus TaxID=297713 RepID=A0AAW0DMR7_9AGAR
MFTSVGILLSLASFLLYAVLIFRIRSRKGSVLPPGPLGLPIIGNFFDMPRKRPWEVYAKLAKNYESHLLSMELPGVTLIILNDVRTATDLLTKRAAKYSDRPGFSLLNEINSFRMFVLQRYGEQWKNDRKMFKNCFESETFSARRTHGFNAVRRLVTRLLVTHGKDHEQELGLAVGEFILLVTYGILPDGKDDPSIKFPGELITTLSIIQRQSLIVDAFPFLKFLPSWFPGTVNQYHIERGIDLLDKIGGETTIVPSVCSRYLSLISDRGDAEDQLDDIKNVLGTAYMAGMDTVLGILENFVVGMLLYPSVQTKAQYILDSALGDRLPELSDYGTIPYIDALLDEVVRWMPVVPMGLPHALIEDDIYGGYTLPKKAICIANIWAMLQDEETFGPNTNNLSPERFLDVNGHLLANKGDSVDVIFGFGRRSCPGKTMAQEFLWMAIASILTACEICEGKDEDGLPLVGDRPESGPDDGLLVMPPRVKCKIKPRKAMDTEIVQESASMGYY